MLSKRLEAAEKFLAKIKENDNRLISSTPLEYAMVESSKSDEFSELPEIELGLVMEVDGITRSTPMSAFLGQSIENRHRPYLLAADLANFVKQRIVSPDLGRLQQDLQFSQGIFARSVGTMHLPSLIDLCGGRETFISGNTLGNESKIGKWKPFTPSGFKYADLEEFATVTPEFIETHAGTMYKYAFVITLSQRVLSDSITMDVFGNWIDQVILYLNVEMLNDLYKRIIASVATADRIAVTTLVETPENGQAITDINDAAWKVLHRQFGKYHGMTDVFCAATQADVLHNLKIREDANVSISSSDSLIDIRNRLIDGTYVWHHFLDDPTENLYGCIDRQSAVAFMNKENSEISEREVNILSGSVHISFSIILGFEVTDDAGVKVVSVNSEE